MATPRIVEDGITHNPHNKSRMPGNQMLVEERNFARIITFNRPQVRNALTTEMVYHLLKLLESWEHDKTVGLILLKGDGNAFSSGGDLRWFYNLTNTERSWKDCVFRKYWLDYRVHFYSKTIIPIIDGVAMGGGAGLAIPCKFRIVTEKTIFAMPEVGIGFHTDCGASYHLARLPKFLGEYLCLTGARLTGAEMFYCGLATHFVPSEKAEELEKSLLASNTCDHTSIQDIVEGFSMPVEIHNKSILHSMNIIQKCFSKASVEEILDALEMESRDESSLNWVSETIEILRKSSPTSLKATLRSIRTGRTKTLEECIFQEYCLTLHFLKGTISFDLYEGIRAKVIDKDYAPKWEPACLSDVTEAKLDQIFTPLDDEERYQLKRRRYN